MQITATELKRRLGRYLDQAETTPVMVEKSGRLKSVVISYDMYEKLTAIEDKYWALKAIEAEKSGYLSADETMSFLTTHGDINAANQDDQG